MSRNVTTRVVDPMTGAPLAPVVTRRRRPAPPVADTPPEALSFDASPYPEDGTPEDVLAWVGYDPDRVKAAIVAEHGRGTQRPQLLAELTERTR